MESKVCYYCDPPQEKSLTEFHINRKMKDGHANKCKSCDRIAHARYYSNKKIRRKSQLKTNYKMTIKDFNRMYREQDGRCAICGVGEAKLVVDHDHLTGFARGLLCGSCNHGLGRFKDNIDILRSAITYLEISNEQQRFLATKATETEG